MKTIILFSVLILGLYKAFAQLPSDCNVPDALRIHYDLDVKNLAVNWLYEIKSPDTALIDIPQWCQDTVWRGLAAIYNRNDLPEVDSIFNKFCIHEEEDLYAIWNVIAVYIDTTYAWTKNWMSLEQESGIADLDTLLQRYGFRIQYFDIEHLIVSFQTEQTINTLLFCDSLQSFPGINYAMPHLPAPNYALPKIEFHETGEVKYYTFSLGWGFSNRHNWHFIVNPDCTIEFIGNDPQWYVDPLPDPANCNIMGKPEPPGPDHEMKIYPNPASGPVTIFITGNSLKTNFTIMDLSGRLNMEEAFKGGETQIDLSNLPSGVYIVKVRNETGIKVGKIIKE